jgi:hypothetical protein
MFQRNLLPPASALKMEAVYYSETLVCTVPTSPHDLTTQKTNIVSIKLILLFLFFSSFRFYLLSPSPPYFPLLFCLVLPLFLISASRHSFTPPLLTYGTVFSLN